MKPPGHSDPFGFNVLQWIHVSAHVDSFNFDNGTKVSSTFCFLSTGNSYLSLVESRRWNVVENDTPVRRVFFWAMLDSRRDGMTPLREKLVGDLQQSHFRS